MARPLGRGGVRFPAGPAPHTPLEMAALLRFPAGPATMYMSRQGRRLARQAWGGSGSVPWCLGRQAGERHTGARRPRHLAYVSLPLLSYLCLVIAG